MSKTCEQLRSEIERRLGFFPEFFDPALNNPRLLSQLWQQSLSFYLQSSLPRPFAEKLFFYLSGLSGIPFRLVAFGEERDIATWDKLEAPEKVFNGHADHMLQLLNAIPEPLNVWPPANSDVEKALLVCSLHLFLRRKGYGPYEQALERVLGPQLFPCLLDFLSYMRLSQFWVECHPELIEKQGAKDLPRRRTELPLMRPFWNLTTPKPAPVVSESSEKLLRVIKQNTFAEKLIESSLDGIQAYDRNFRYVLWNSAMERMTGVPRARVINRVCFEVFPFLKESKKDQVLREVLDGKSVIVRDQVYAIPETDQHLFFEAHHSPIVDDSGEIIGGLAILRDITDRKRAEEALRQSESLHRTVVETAEDVIFTLTPDGTIRSFNESFERQSGFRREDWIGKSFLPLIHPDDRGLAEENVRQVNLGKARRNAQVRAVIQSGEVRYHEISSIPQIKNGEVIGIIGISRDITDRKRAEDGRAQLIRAQVARVEAEASERRYRQLAEAIPLIVWTAQADGSVDYGNLRWNEYTGAPRGAGLGEGWIGMLHPEEKERVHQAWRQAVERGEDYKIECRLRKADGTYGWNLMLAIAVRGESGAVVKWFGTSTDIDEQKKVEEALRDSEQTSRKLMEELERSDNRYQLVSRATNDCIWDWDLRANQVSWNRGVSQLFGYPEIQEPNPSEWWESKIHPDDRERVTQSIREILKESGPNWRAEYRFQRQDGSYAYVVDRGFVVRDERQVPIRMVGAMADITERRRAEDELRLKTEGLARSNAELEQFAYVASHDLKEPLRMVNSYLQLLERHFENRLEPDAADFFNFAREGAARMYELIDDLLAYSRIGAPDNSSRKVDCGMIFDVAVANLETSVRENGVTVTRGPLPIVRGEKTQLIQLFQNLFANAIKFRSEASPRIHVSAQRRNKSWVFSVEDNGIGIAPEFAQRIFVIFQRLHTRDKYPGTGIGLAICKKIVERHGGSIWVESQLGKGSTFFFEIPAEPDYRLESK